MDIGNILDEIDNFYIGNNNVYNFLNKKELENTLNFDPLIKIKNDDEMISLLKKIIKYSVKTNHLMFFNQLFKGSNFFPRKQVHLKIALFLFLEIVFNFPGNSSFNILFG